MGTPSRSGGNRGDWAADGRPEELFDLYYARLAKALMKSGMDVDAEDIAQEAVTRAWLWRDELDFDSSIWPWLRTVAFNLAADRCRARARQILSEPDDLPDSNAMATTVVENLHIRNTLKLLPERQAQAIALHYLEDRSASDVSNTLGLSRAAFNQLLYRARSSFRAAYGSANKVARGFSFLGVRRLWGRHGDPDWKAQRLVTLWGPSQPLLTVTTQQLTAGVVSLMLSVSTPHLAKPPLQRSTEDVLQLQGSTKPSNHRQQSDPRHRTLPSRAPSAKVGSSGTSIERAKAVVTSNGDDPLRPNNEVATPEDARIVSIAHSSAYSEDGTVYAAGITRCGGSMCPNVLFRSADSGRTWSKLPAHTFRGYQLLLPPEFGREDHRIFAMGVTGLQVSEDGGTSFSPAAVAGANQTVGSAAMSPGFNDGDPTILIGAETLMRYRDDLRTIEAVPSTALPGPLEPTFSTQYASDRKILVGGLRFDPVLGQAVATVFSCADGVCSTTHVSRDRQSPKIRLAASYGRDGLVHAFTQWGIFESRDGGLNFSRVKIGWDSRSVLTDLLVGDDGRDLIASVVSVGPTGSGEGGIYLTKDGGDSWSRIDDPLLEDGGHVLSRVGNVLLVGLRDGGIACSTNRGVTWSRRCG